MQCISNIPCRSTAGTQAVRTLDQTSMIQTRMYNFWLQNPTKYFCLIFGYLFRRLTAEYIISCKPN